MPDNGICSKFVEACPFHPIEDFYGTIRPVALLQAEVIIRPAAARSNKDEQPPMAQSPRHLANGVRRLRNVFERQPAQYQIHLRVPVGKSGDIGGGESRPHTPGR